MVLHFEHRTNLHLDGVKSLIHITLFVIVLMAINSRLSETNDDAFAVSVTGSLNVSVLLIF